MKIVVALGFVCILSPAGSGSDILLSYPDGVLPGMPQSNNLADAAWKNMCEVEMPVRCLERRDYTFYGTVFRRGCSVSAIYTGNHAEAVDRVVYFRFVCRQDYSLKLEKWAAGAPVELELEN